MRHYFEKLVVLKKYADIYGVFMYLFISHHISANRLVSHEDRFYFIKSKRHGAPSSSPPCTQQHKTCANCFAGQHHWPLTSDAWRIHTQWRTKMASFPCCGCFSVTEQTTLTLLTLNNCLRFVVFAYVD